MNMPRYSVIAILRAQQEKMLQHFIRPFTVEVLPDESPCKIISDTLCTIIQELRQNQQYGIIEIVSVSHTLIG